MVIFRKNRWANFHKTVCRSLAQLRGSHSCAAGNLSKFIWKQAKKKEKHLNTRWYDLTLWGLVNSSECRAFFYFHIGVGSPRFISFLLLWIDFFPFFFSFMHGKILYVRDNSQTKWHYLGKSVVLPDDFKRLVWSYRKSGLRNGKSHQCNDS